MTDIESNRPLKIKASSSDDLKILIIGSLGHQYVECIKWDTDPLPNIVDYHVVVVNVRTLTDELLLKINFEKIEEYQVALTRLLISRGLLLILTDFSRSVKRDIFPNYISNYDWLPIEIGIRKESGTTIKIIRDLYPKYFSSLKKWDYFFYITADCLKRVFYQMLGHSNTTDYTLPINNLIENRYKKPLAAEILTEVRYVKESNPSEPLFNRKYYDKTPDKILGPIVLLPLLEGIDSKEAVNLLLEDMIGKPQTSLPPDWVKAVQMPLVPNIQNQIDGKNEEIGRLQEEVNSLEEQKDNIEYYKKLIYCDGPELEDVFKICLTELGVTIEPAKYAEEEYCLVFKGKEYPVEAKGNAKSVSLTNLRQLMDYMLKYEEETEEKCKGILLGNAWKNKPIEERNSKETLIFPNNVITRACDLNIALLSSVDFFYIFCSFLEGKITGEKIVDKIVNSKGVVDFRD